MFRNSRPALTAACLLSMFSAGAVASPAEVSVTPEVAAEEPVYSPFVGRDYPDQVLFGDETPATAIVAVVPIVAQHEIVA